MCNAAPGPKNSVEICSYLWATQLDIEVGGQHQFAFVAGEFDWTGFDYLAPVEAKERNGYNRIYQPKCALDVLAGRH